MGFIIETTEGTTVGGLGKDGYPADTYDSIETAEASVADRNNRAEQMGLQTRYRVREDG